MLDSITGPGGVACERVAGRAFGDLDPKLPVNAIVQDVALGTEADGKLHYVATFTLDKPVDLSKASGLMWHDVPNRGRRLPDDAQGPVSAADATPVLR
jgi:hypothetical protein